MQTRTHDYELYALLLVTKASEERVSSFLAQMGGIRKSVIRRGLHLTVYYARRPLPGLVEGTWPVHISANTDETRFMVLAPGGENPRPEIDPRRHSIGIRLTRRNRAIADIQQLRKSVYQLETDRVVGCRKRTTAWTSCFGARHYQPHITLLRSDSRIQHDLTEIGSAFRSEVEGIEFDRFQIKVRSGRE